MFQSQWNHIFMITRAKVKGQASLVSEAYSPKFNLSPGSANLDYSVRQKKYPLKLFAIF